MPQTLIYYITNYILHKLIIIFTYLSNLCKYLKIIKIVLTFYYTTILKLKITKINVSMFVFVNNYQIIKTYFMKKKKCTTLTFRYYVYLYRKYAVILWIFL